MSWSPTPLQARMLAVIGDIPPGEVMTYGEVAAEAGAPGAARAVGRTLRDATVAVPWWRVVPASGRLAPHLAQEQSARLRAEGVAVTDGRVRLVH